MLEPTKKQLENSEGMGWQYIGSCLFVKSGLVGWFSDQGFIKMTEEEWLNE